MMFTCIDRIRNSSNVITHYRLKRYNENNIIILVKAEDLKKQMISGVIQVDNLKVSKANRILFADNTDKISIQSTQIMSYAIQVKENIETYSTIIKDQNNRTQLTEAEKEALKRMNGFYVSYHFGQGKLSKALSELKQCAQHEYESLYFDEEKVSIKNSSKMLKITQSMVNTEVKIMPSIASYKYLLNVLAYTSTYKQEWRILAR